MQRGINYSFESFKLLGDGLPRFWLLPIAILVLETFPPTFWIDGKQLPVLCKYAWR